MKTYLIHWRNGSKNIIKGTSFIDACNNDYIFAHEGIIQDIEKLEEIEEYTYPPNISSKIQENKDHEIVMKFLINFIDAYSALGDVTITEEMLSNITSKLSKDLCTKIRNNK